MGPDPAYHTNSPEYSDKEREVYHDHNACWEGKRILEKHREKGTAGRPRCKVCISLG
jgi:hypothetical protein